MARKKINLLALKKKYKLFIFAGLLICLTGFKNGKLLILINLLLNLQQT
jgi:hypothetical protein